MPPGFGSQANPNGTGNNASVGVQSGGVYDPNSFLGQGEQSNVDGLLGSEGEETLQPGSKGLGGSGSILVPYVDVLASYRNAFVQAVASENIPLGLRSLVRAYFSALVDAGS